METMYTTFRCGSCKRTNIVITREYKEAIQRGKYLSCVYCDCRHLKKKSPTDNLIECFKNSDKKR